MLARLTGLVGRYNNVLAVPVITFVAESRYARLFYKKIETGDVTYQQYVIERLDNKRGGDSWRRYKIVKNKKPVEKETNPPEYVHVNGARKKPVDSDSVKKKPPVSNAVSCLVRPFFTIEQYDLEELKKTIRESNS
jgi:hypothetical protein